MTALELPRTVWQEVMMRKRSLIMIAALTMLASIPLPAGEIPIGTEAPGFSLINAADGRYVRFEPGKNRPSVVIFTCNECPYAQAFEPRIIELARKYKDRGVAFYAVNPNDESKYPGEAIHKMKERAMTRAYPFPYLKDTDSSVARAYGARVTPHVFVVDGGGRIRYRGYVDDSAKAHEREHAGLSDALDAILSGTSIAKASTKAFGCTIKWRSGT